MTYEGVWTKRMRELGWDHFGNEASALHALRGLLEDATIHQHNIGRITLLDALHEHKEREVQHRDLRDKAMRLFEWADSVLGEPDKAMGDFNIGIEITREAKEAINK